MRERGKDRRGIAAWERTDWLRTRARALPDHLALRDNRESVSFGELDGRADRTARQLAALGVGAGARVAVLLRNGVTYALLTHALPRLGAIMVPVNIRLAVSELAWILADSQAGVLVTERALVDQAAAAARDRTEPAVIVVEDLDRAVEAAAPLRHRIDPDAIQGIVYTSATSGRPKGVMLTFGNHWWSAMASALRLSPRPDDCWLVPLPLYHVGGLAVLWRSVIYGIPAVIHESFDAAAVNNEIDEGRVTQISLVSTMLQGMLDARAGRRYPSTLRRVLLGGGPAPQALLEACLRLGVPVAPTYGLTEAASQVATLLPADVARRPGSCGKPLFPTDVRIEDGEILVRGPTVMIGYADRPEDTARVLRGGWLHTGDLGALDDDGYLYVTDRREDLIVTGGENVYPAEVEAVLRQHEAIEDAAVIGVLDEAWGEAVAAALTVRPGARVNDDELSAFCAARLARFKVPRRYWVVDALPRASSGKVLRRLLREQARRWDGT